MKRIVIILIISISTFQLFAQTEFDVLRYIQTDITGSARYSSMAGAFGALGGDPSAIKDNPAGLGIYRRSEITGTISNITQGTSSQWNGVNATDGMYKFGFNNVSYVISTAKSSSNSLVHSNWSFSYNRLKDYNRNLKINGGNTSSSSITDYAAYFTGNIYGPDLFETDSYNPFNNTAVPWISILAANSGLIIEDIDEVTDETLGWYSLLNANEKVSPSYAMREQGYINEYAVSWSGNFNNRFFLGATLNLYDMNYRADTEYKESFGEGGSMSLFNVMKSKASGVGLKIGGIYAPLDFMRLGLSIQTPVKYIVSDTHYADLFYDYGTNSNGKILTPEGDNSYKIQSPFVYHASASFILGRKALIGVEYVHNKNSGSKLMDLNNGTFDYGYENDSISALFNNQHTLKIGVEYKLNDNFSLRAGYAYTGPVSSPSLAKEMIPNTIRTDMEYFTHNNTRYITAGLGYRESSWYIDVALMNRLLDERFSPYNYKKLESRYVVQPASVLTTNLSIIASLGFRF